MVQIARVLRGRCVLVVHEDRFHAAYLADVLRGADANVLGPAASIEAAHALLGEATVDAMVLGSSMPGWRDRDLVERASRGGGITLLVHAGRTGTRPPPAALPVLDAPYAGFQVIEALVDLLAAPAPGAGEVSGFRDVPLELWGGVECTVNRVGDRYRDQTRLSGHHDRPDDLDLFADLGLAAIRYPVLWERVAAEGWDLRLARLRGLGIRPIAGLVHHGSGPPHTHLLDDGFAPDLADHAAQAAARYPWIEEWTPVNEPLTTARFAALYGHWYPHHGDERSFWLALLNQIDAVRLSMLAIRQVIPSARLILTDDLGRTFATPRLAQQARHDNMRRWAGWDLLFGRVTPSDPLGRLLARHGLAIVRGRSPTIPAPPM